MDNSNSWRQTEVGVPEKGIEVLISDGETIKIGKLTLFRGELEWDDDGLNMRELHEYPFWMNLPTLPSL